ncbi:MAG: ABC transporter ATP-binding protein [Firmicutes bacterium]|nr:ABC transporter ATP-binding protein [Bacillota bacterium]
MLAVEHLSVHYGVIQALHDISFSVRSGEIYTLLGTNGAGKTTTLRTLSRLITKTSGKVEFDGKDISHVPSHTLPALGLCHVPEGRRVFPELSVRDNLLLGAYHRTNKQEVKDDLHHVFELFPRLKERHKQEAGSLSGGEQQMLAMGRGLMGRPKLLLLDEPSMGLAPLLVEEIFTIIQTINRAGTTVLLVEQNAHLALSISQRACVLETGRVVMTGAARDIFADPRIQEVYLGVS